MFSKNLLLTNEETAFLLVLLSEQETISKRMEEISFPIEGIDLDSLIERIRQLAWSFHTEKQEN